MRLKSNYRYLFLTIFLISHFICLSQTNLAHDIKLENDENIILNNLNRGEITPLKSSSPYLISNFTDGIGYAQGVFIQDDVLFLSDSANGSMTTLDISNPAEPKYLDWFQSAETITSGAFVEENIAYLPSNFGLEILDISDPNNIDWISMYFDEIGGSTYDIVVNEDIAYISRINDGFEVINVSNPYIPEKINQIEGYFLVLDVKENFAYVTQDLVSVSVIDITDPTNSTGTFKATKILELGDIACIISDGDIMYVVEPTEGLFAYDITNPINPVYITSLDLGEDYGGKKMFIENDIAYITTMNGGVKIINVSDPYNLEEMDGYIGNGGIGNDIIVRDGIIYLSDGADGLEIINGGYGVDLDDDEIELEAPIITSSNGTVNQTTIRIEWQEVMDAEYYNIYLNGELYYSTLNTWVLLNFYTEGTRYFTITTVSGNNESEHSNPLEIIFDFSDDNNNDDSDNNTLIDPFANISITGYPFEIIGFLLVFAVALKLFLLSKKKIDLT
ncbi:MAG: LVIVD repeat-containing protein [Promethearchaeota archaeon]